jgi:hypothetical protein
VRSATLSDAEKAKHAIPISEMGQFQHLFASKQQQALRNPLSDKQEAPVAFFGNPYSRKSKGKVRQRGTHVMTV